MRASSQTLEELVSAAPTAPREDRLERWVGLAILALAFGGFGVWAMLAPLDSAAVAPGVVTVESNRKAVQHLEGGIVREILVKEGDQVKPGDVLIRLDDTQARAQLEIVRSQYLAHRAREARLIAERDGRSSVEYPEELVASRDDPRVAEALAGQSELFAARAKALNSEVDVLGQRIEQLKEQIRGLEGLAASALERVESYRAEIKDFRGLFDKGLGDKLRLRELERLAAGLEGQRQGHLADVATANVRIGETRLQVVQVERKLQSEVATELREVQTALFDLRERMRGLQDTLSRTELRAPAGGSVVGLQAHTEGGVIPAGGVILEIVPVGEDLLVQAQVNPIDIDKVVVGLEADIRFSAFAARVTPTVRGTVLTVSADRLVDRATGAAYYLARVQVRSEELSRLTGFTVLPGMPAEVFIKTGERTLFQYLMQPLTDRVNRSFRED